MTIERNAFVSLFKIDWKRIVHSVAGSKRIELFDSLGASSIVCYLNPFPTLRI